jgi:hypothetical protein
MPLILSTSCTIRGVEKPACAVTVSPRYKRGVGVVPPKARHETALLGDPVVDDARSVG